MEATSQILLALEWLQGVSSADTIAIASLLASIIALIVSVIALVYTARAFWLKAGAQIRGSFTICSDVACDDKYVSSVTLQNLKDKEIAIFKVYLRIGHSYFLQIENFQKAPLKLGPFETLRREYDPLDFYSVNIRRINLNAVLEKKGIKHKLVLVTTDGEYVIRKPIRSWDPAYLFFDNHLTAVIQPLRSTYKGKVYGGNAKFLVEFKMANGKEELVPIYPDDFEIRKFRHFALTKEALETQASLESFLYDRVSDGSLPCVDLVVHEMEEWRKQVYEMQNKQVIEATNRSWFVYYVLGRVYTFLSNQRLRRKKQVSAGSWQQWTTNLAALSNPEPYYARHGFAAGLTTMVARPGAPRYLAATRLMSATVTARYF